MARFAANFSVLFLIWTFGIVYYLDIFKLARQDKMVVEVLLAFLALVLSFRTIVTIMDFLKCMKKRKADGEHFESFVPALKKVLRRKESIFLAVTVPYVALVPILGFFVSTGFYLFLANIVLGTKNRVQRIAIPLGVTLFTYLLFALLFGVRLPRGILF
jgi:hypothetical protein